MHTNVFTIGLIGIVGLVGCAATPEPEDQERPASASAAQRASGLQEYRHTADRSRMQTGPNAVSSLEDGHQKVVGDWGTLAINQKNGHSQGVPNADAAMLARAPFGSNLAQHNDHVKDMFIAAGVPAGEIGSVQGSTGGGWGGRAGEPPQPIGNPWYTSTLTRVADGIPIAESFAWARINDRDAVVSEAVYWPAIPQTVIDQARTLKAKLDVPATRKAFVDGLRVADRSSALVGRVAIRHSSAVFDGAFEARAVYDISVRDEAGASYTQHFDASGAEVRLPQELRASVDTPRAPRARTTR